MSEFWVENWTSEQRQGREVTVLLRVLPLFFLFFFGLWVCMCEYEYVYVGLWFVVRVCDWRFGLFEVMMVIVLEGDDSWCCEDGGYGGYGIIML
jgi:hypothetical protein